MKNILITGANGFLGSHNAEFFKENKFRVVGIDKTEIKQNNTSGRYFDKFIQAQVSKETIQSIDEEFNIIVHCAGGSSVSKSFENPKQDYIDTVGSLKEVMEYMRINNRKAKLIYPSSAAVYGNTNNIPINESEELNPVSPYGLNKKIAEELCKTYHDDYGIDINIIRFFSLYGIGIKKQLLWDACNKFSSASANVEFFGTGEEVRDWLNIEDAISLINLLSTNRNKFETINGASGEGIKVKEIIELISKEFGNKKQIIFDNIERHGDPKIYVADVGKSLKMGWKRQIDIESGIRSYVKWYKNLF